MKAGGGVLKGGAFEREICRELSLWVSYEAKDDIFWRSAMSGGRATVGMKKGIKRTNQAGDITAIDPIGNKLTDKYMIECKSYKNIQLHSMLFGKPKNNSIYEFWMELAHKSKQLDKYMMLIIKQNGMPKLLGLTSSPLQKTLKEDYALVPLATFSSLLPVMYLYNFEYILNLVDPVCFE